MLTDKELDDLIEYVLSLLRLREPLKIHFGRQANFFDSGLRQKKQALASAKPDFSSLPEVKKLLLAAQKQLLELPLTEKGSFGHNAVMRT